MQTIYTTEKTSHDGTLTIKVPLSQPDTEFEVVIVVQLKSPTHGTTTPASADPWAGANAIRQRLAATGRHFEDSVQDIREDRER